MKKRVILNHFLLVFLLVYTNNVYSYFDDPAVLTTGKVDVVIEEIFDADTHQWVNNIKYEYMYDSNGNRTVLQYYQWDVNTDQWGFWKKENSTYDDNNNQSQKNSYDWDENTSQWINNQKYEYSYDSENNRMRTISYSWDSNINQWVNNSKNDYSYDSDNILIEDLFTFWDITISLWVNKYKTEYTSDPNYIQPTEVYYNWDLDSNEWIKDARRVFYDVHSVGSFPSFYSNKTVESYDRWYEPSAWLSYGQIISDPTYDSYENEVQVKKFIAGHGIRRPPSGGPPGPTGVPYKKTDNIYNSKNHLIHSIFYNYSQSIVAFNSNIKSEWLFDYRITFKLVDDSDSDGVKNDVDTCPNTPIGELVDAFGCSEILLSIEEEQLKKGITFYPNPVANILTIDSKTPLKKVEIFSVLNKKLMEVSSNFESISVERLSKGIYLVRVFSEETSTVIKLIKE